MWCIEEKYCMWLALLGYVLFIPSVIAAAFGHWFLGGAGVFFYFVFNFTPAKGKKFCEMDWIV